MGRQALPLLGALLLLLLLGACEGSREYLPIADGGADLGADPLSTPPRCTSMRYWRPDDDDDDDVRQSSGDRGPSDDRWPSGDRGPSDDRWPSGDRGPSDDRWPSDDDGDARMNPGMACLACHARQRGPALLAAGTVYPTAHEPDLCLGAAAATVELTDARGVVKTLTTNSSGNFQVKAQGLQLPLRVRVLSQGRERRMASPVTQGDCNACHSQAGSNGAPGRITLP